MREQMPEMPPFCPLSLWGRVGVPLKRKPPFTREPGVGAADYSRSGKLLQLNQTTIAARYVHILLQHADSLAVGEDHRRHQRLALALHIGDIHLRQHIALAHAVALLDARGEALPLQLHRIHADMNQQLATIVTGDAVGVSGREGDLNRAAKRRDHHAVLQLNRDAVAHAF